MRKLGAFAFILCLSTLAMTGCVLGRTYRTAIPVEVVPPTPTPYTQDSLVATGKPCDVTNAADFQRPCLSYIEFDDQGELRVAPGDIPPEDNNYNPRIHCLGGNAKKNPTQVDFAKDLICAAMKPGPGEKTQPIVFVFVHGWKHNAAQKPVEDANVQGVKDVLDALRNHYPDTPVNTEDPTQNCASLGNGCVLLRHPVIGIYIGWRGESTSQYFPVARTFSIINRQSTAFRVGNTSLTDAITEISATAHPLHSETDPFQPFLLMMGHSLGGVILERTLAQALMERMDEPVNRHSREVSASKAPLADLVVFVNTAVAATESKQVIDRLARHEAEDGILNPARPDQLDKRYPQIISLSSQDDQATLSLITVAHAIPAFQRWVMGSARSNVPMLCYEPEIQQAGQIDKFSQTDFYLHTAPHFEALQSHEVKELSASQCEDANHKPTVQALADLGKPRTGKELEEWLRDSFGPLVMDNACYVVVPRNSLLKPEQPVPSTMQRCNGTPYFVMEVPHDIIPDHGTIFTGRHLQFLTIFFQVTKESAKHPTQPQKGVILKDRFSYQ